MSDLTDDVTDDEIQTWEKLIVTDDSLCEARGLNR